MRFVIFHAAFLIAIASCSSEGPAPAPPGQPAPNDPCRGIEDRIICAAGVAHTCSPDGRSSAQDDCVARDETCQPGRGCVICIPGEVRCNGNQPRVCNADGESFTEPAACDADAGEYCSPLGCAALCTEAAENDSYIGCEYWPTTVFNPAIRSDFEYAVVVANPQLVEAQVTIHQGGAMLREVSVGPGALETIRLPWNLDLKDGGEVDTSIPIDEDIPPPMSLVERGGAYHLRSNVPVTVYQFNPLEYRIESDCEFEREGEGNDGQCFAYTNDASLLLPSHTFRNRYIVTARPTQTLDLTFDDGFSAFETTPGFVSIMATVDGTEIDFHSRARVVGSEDGGIQEMMPDESQRFTLNQGDVLQLLSGSPIDRCPTTFDTERTRGARVKYCHLDNTYDLTGSEISSNHPIGVISGHGCSFVPFNRWACDHLEESLFPIEAWGKDVVVTISHPLRGEPDLIRIVSSRDGNTITFEPPILEPVLLQTGDFVEFEAENHVRIRSTEPMSVAQFLVGQDYHGAGMNPPGSVGDPSMAFAVPTEQYRSEYTVLTPESFVRNYLNLTAPTGTRVLVDGELVDDWIAIGETDFSVARVQVSGGVHKIEGARPFGVLVYGFGAYTSYMYPGGLDLSVIAPLI